MDEAKEQIDKFFSRKLLVGFLLSTACGKILEKTLEITVGPEAKPMLVGYIGSAIVLLFVFIFWHRIEDWFERHFWSKLYKECPHCGNKIR